MMNRHAPDAIDKRILAPFSPEQVQRLNEWQTNTGEGLSAHPFTCANRDDGQHGDAGGDIGILIATEGGWVCPFCDYTQNWAHAIMAAPSASLVAIIGPSGESWIPHHSIAELDRHLLSYRALAAKGRIGAAVMVGCLLRRRESLAKHAGRQLAYWVVYDHPSDFPNCFVARKFLTLYSGELPAPTNETLSADTLADLRAKLPAGLIPIERAPDDDPVVLETWL